MHRADLLADLDAWLRIPGISAQPEHAADVEASADWLVQAPLRTGFPISDTISGITAAFAIASALVEQRATGRGRRIDVSLLEATLAAMGVSPASAAGALRVSLGWNTVDADASRFLTAFERVLQPLYKRCGQAA